MLDISGDGGVIKQILSQGVGDKSPMHGCLVSIHYTGKYSDGTVFDSSVERGEPFEFVLGKDSVIKAFELTIKSMKVNERCLLTCRPNYVFANILNASSNEALIFELELLGWKGEDLSPSQDNSIERFIIVRSNRKRTPTEGALVKVYLLGEYQGKTFEEREVHFECGYGSDLNIVEGVEIALKKIRVGETSRIKIKPKYAFGCKGNSNFNIPPNALVEYTVKLLECEKGTEEWKLDDAERIEQSNILKAKGRLYFQKNNYALAAKTYKKSLNVLPIKDSDEIQKEKILLKLNIALCLQKTGEHFETKALCNDVLKYDSMNIKALFRRGRSNLAINELDEALTDFEKLAELEPSNKSIVNQIALCKQKKERFKNEEKKIYANMFTKFAVEDEQKVCASEDEENDFLSRCDEWAETDTKREADLAFEHDNIVMI